MTSEVGKNDSCWRAVVGIKLKHNHLAFRASEKQYRVGGMHLPIGIFDSTLQALRLSLHEAMNTASLCST